MKTSYQILLASFLMCLCGSAQIQNSGDFRMHSGSAMGVFGNLTNNGSFGNNLGTLYVVGSNPQTFNGANLIQTKDLVINKSSDSLQLDNELQVSGVLTFTNGRICSDHADKATEYVHFLDGASYLGVSDVSHVDGVVRKTGDDPFTFPVGDDTNYQPISIDAPAVITDAFTAEYFEVDANPQYDRNLKENSIHHLSSCEYWILDRTTGNSNVNVTLAWDVNSCGVNALNDLLVARWDGAEWKNHGNGLVTGSTVAGTITTSSAVTSFSPFTLGSMSSYNPLPVELTYFQASKVDRDVLLEWETNSEINNDFFTIERSTDVYNFESIATIDGAGNSNMTINYSTIDENPLNGISYYRLKQTDFDGQEKYSQVVSMDFNIFDDNDQLSIYPNPAFPEFFNLILPLIDKSFELFVVDNNGKLIFSDVIHPLGNQTMSIYPPEPLSSGQYNVVLVSQDKSWTTHLIIN